MVAGIIALLALLAYLVFSATDQQPKATPSQAAASQVSGTSISQAAQPQTPAGSTSPAVTAVKAPASAVVAAPAVMGTTRFVMSDSGMDRSFAIATDELVKKSPDGVEKSVALPPQSDLRGLREAWNNLRRQGGGEVFPVVYEEGAERNISTRRLVTPEIRVELKEGESLAEAIPGAVEVSRPAYAPGFMIVKMPDSFAALDALSAVRSLSGVKHADVLLAQQMALRTLPNDPLITSQWHLKNTGQSGGTVGIDVNVEPVWNY
ncbi:MAG TPA: hypothetical protein VNB29_03690, partial [Chthoniobacterales bacterium]|nr:hypothetical protein [Chthoniobacterales bacterium]